MVKDRPQFNSFSPHKAVIVYRRHLPHWRQEGACYFVTYRLADSIPARVLAEWREERQIWFEVHGMDPDALHGNAWRVAYERIPVAERERFERRHYRQVHDCLDHAHGSCWLHQADNARLALDALLFFHGSRCWTGDAVVMPNHVHVLIVPRGGVAVERLLQSVKRHSSRVINEQIKREGTLWQKDSYDHIVRDRKELRAFRRYILKNATQAGLAAGSGAFHLADWLDEFAAP
jgi:putative transposase